jgi:hypothetical protein
MSHYSDLPKEAQQLVARGLQALVEIKQRELTATKQSLIVVKSVMAHPEDPTRWPLPVPWPEGFVVRRANGEFVCLNHYKLPREWTPFLKDAYVWKTRDMAERVAADRIGGDPHALSIEDICTTIGATL